MPPYWLLVVLVVTAGALFGLSPPTWPWRRPHPVRTTVGLVLCIAGLAVVIAVGLAGSGVGRPALGGILAAVGLTGVVAVWLAPNQSAMTRWVYVIGYGWWLYVLYGRYFSAS